METVMDTSLHYVRGRKVGFAAAIAHQSFRRLVGQANLVTS